MTVFREKGDRVADLSAAGFGDYIAERIRAEHISISARWLERLRGFLTVEANDVFPTADLDVKRSPHSRLRSYETRSAMGVV
jgi:hypothetical protein